MLSRTLNTYIVHPVDTSLGTWLDKHGPTRSSGIWSMHGVSFELLADAIATSP